MSLLLSAVYFGAGNAYSETLDKAVQATLQNHPSVETAKTDSDIANQERREGRSGYFPEVQMTTQGGRIYGDNSTSRGLSVTRGAAYSNMWEASVTARQMIFDGFQTSNKVHSAKARMEAADLNILDVRERLAFSTAQAYIDLLRARSGLNLILGHVKKVSEYQSRIKGMVDEGASDEAEYQQAHDISVILEGIAADYEGQVRAAEANYMAMTGYIPQEELSPPLLRDDLISQDVEEAVTYVKANHPALRSGASAVKSAEYDAKAEKGSLYPGVSGELSYLKSEKKDVIGGEATDARAVLRMNWNLETGGAQFARINQKELRKKEAASRVREQEREIERVLRLAYAEYHTAEEQLDTQKQRTGLNEKLFETYKVQFDGARITLLQLMQSDNQLFTANLEKLNGDYRLLAARFGVLASMGRLQEALNLVDVASPEEEAKPQKKAEVVTTPGLLTNPSGNEQN